MSNLYSNLFENKQENTNLFFKLLIQDLLNSGPHFFNELPLGFTYTDLVGDIINATNRFGVLTVNTSWLQVIISAQCFQLTVLRDLWHLDVNASSQASTNVSWAEGQITKLVVLDKLQLGLHDSNSLLRRNELLALVDSLFQNIKIERQEHLFLKFLIKYDVSVLR